MSRHITCDFCNKKLTRFEQDIVRVAAMFDKHEWAADYHPACWERILEVVRLAQTFEGAVAAIPVASPQKITAARRKHTKPDDEGDDLAGAS